MWGFFGVFFAGFLYNFISCCYFLFALFLLLSPFLPAFGSFQGGLKKDSAIDIPNLLQFSQSRSVPVQKGEGRPTFSRPFSYIFLINVTSVSGNNEAKEANCASRMEMVLNTWANKCWQNLIASDCTVPEIHTVLTKLQCGIYKSALFSIRTQTFFRQLVITS